MVEWTNINWNNRFVNPQQLPLLCEISEAVHIGLSILCFSLFFPEFLFILTYVLFPKLFLTKTVFLLSIYVSCPTKLLMKHNKTYH